MVVSPAWTGSICRFIDEGKRQPRKNMCISMREVFLLRFVR